MRGDSCKERRPDEQSGMTGAMFQFALVQGGDKIENNIRIEK